jgi:hypothetical protein
MHPAAAGRRPADAYLFVESMLAPGYFHRPPRGFEFEITGRDERPTRWVLAPAFATHLARHGGAAGVTVRRLWS